MRRSLLRASGLSRECELELSGELPQLVPAVYSNRLPPAFPGNHRLKAKRRALGLVNFRFELVVPLQKFSNERKIGETVLRRPGTRVDDKPAVLVWWNRTDRSQMKVIRFDRTQRAVNIAVIRIA